MSLLRSRISPIFVSSLLLPLFGGIGQAATGPDLKILLTHTSQFLRGQTNAVYLIRVGNQGDAATSGLVTVTESMPSAVTITTMWGPGWTCQTNACSRTDSLAAGQMYPTISVLATIATDAPASVDNTATVSGGGDVSFTNNVLTETAKIAAEGYAVTWGDPKYIGGFVPADISDFVSVSAGTRHALGLRKDGRIVQWGYSGVQKPSATQSMTGFVAIAAGNNVSCAVKSDGSVVMWQSTGDPLSLGSLDFSNTVAISSRSTGCTPLKADGTTLASGVTIGGDIFQKLFGMVQISTVDDAAIGLRWDGTVVTWGSMAAEERQDLGNLREVVAPYSETGAGLREDGTVVAWSAYNGFGLLNVPANLNHVASLSASTFGAAVLDDGTTVGWGDNGYGILSYLSGLVNIRQVAAGSGYLVALTSTKPVSLRVQSDVPDVLPEWWSTTAMPDIFFDGVSSNVPVNLLVPAGSTHTLATELVQLPGQSGPVQQEFLSWSDGGAATHTIVANADSMYLAKFHTNYRVFVTAGTGGTVSPASGYFQAGSTVLVTATPQQGYVFSGFNCGFNSDNSNPMRLFVSKDTTCTASFIQPSTALIRARISPPQPILPGQANAAFVARVGNAGTSALPGATVQIFGSALETAQGSGPGWSCNGDTCTRADALAPGSEYPAILFVGTVNALTQGTTDAAVYVTSGNLAATAHTVAPAFSSANAVRAWGANGSGQATPPSGLTNVVAVAAGAAHSLALKGDGTVAAWGDNSKLQTQVPSLGTVIAIAAGANHSLALQKNGTVKAWGDGGSGQTSVPPSLTSVIAIAAGANHSLALTASGVVSAWGANGSGQTTVPGSVVNAVAIAAGGDHSLAVLRDGTVVAWGSNTDGESTVPGGLTGVVSVAAGAHFSMALKEDGQVVVWGTNPASIQSALPGTLTDPWMLAAGGAHALARPWSGGLLAWGDNGSGQTDVPGDLNIVTGIATGAAHSLAISSGKTQFQWTFTTQPSGASFQIDGVSYTSSQMVNWDYGSAHTVIIPANQTSGNQSSRFQFTSWSDNLTASTRTFIADANRQFQLNFQTQYLLTTTAGAGGSITPPTGYYDNGAQVTVQAAAKSGYSFSGFTGGLTGTTNPRSLTINKAVSVTANFTAIRPAAHLKVDLRHLNTLLQGQTNALSLIRVGNDPTAGPTTSQVQVTVTLPAGITLTSLSGPGWSCTANSCTRGDALAGGQWYPAISALSTISGSASGSLTAQASASGGGDSTPRAASDTMEVYPSAVPVTWVDPFLNPHAGDKPFPTGITDFVAVSSGDAHFLGLRRNGTVVAWGDNQNQECDVPGGLANVVAVSAGAGSSMALKSDGSVVLWGRAIAGTPMPAPLPKVVGIAAGGSALLALKADGTLAAWGLTFNLDMNAVNQATNIVALEADSGAVALTAEGAALTLGASGATPSGVPPLVRISTYGAYYAGTAADGSVTFWGNPSAAGTPLGWSGIDSVALGNACDVGIKSDHTVLQQGCSGFGGTTQPKDIPFALAADGSLSQMVVLTTSAPAISVQVVAQAGSVTVDGATYTQSHTFQWPFGSSHTISVAPLVDTGVGSRAVFAAWSDGGSISHTYVVSSVATVQLSATYTTQYYLTTSATTGGTISPASGWYDEHTNVWVTANPAQGYMFQGFSGTFSGTINPLSVGMSGPVTETATFVVFNPQPTVIGVAPWTGGGASASFLATYDAPLGYTNLGFVQMLVASATDGGGQSFCFVHYDVQGNAFWLYGEGGFFVGPVQPGTASAGLQNSLCALNTATSSAGGSGTRLSLRANLVFKTAASRKVYLRAFSQGNLDTGWVQSGTWNAAATPMATLSVLPASGSGGQQTFSAQYPDPAGFADVHAGWTQFLVAAANDGGGQPFCFLHYDKGGNGLWMYSSDVGFFLGPVAPGTASNALDSSACSVNTGATTVTSYAGVTILNVPLTMKAPMAGTKKLFQRTLDPLFRDSGWVETGAWTIP